MKNNQEILREIADHNQQSFRLLFNSFFPRLTHFSYSMIKNRGTAIAIVDEVFVKFWKNCEHAASIQNINVYLFTAVKNSALNYLSRKPKELITDPFLFSTIQLASGQDPEQRMITAELYRKLQNAVDQLPPRCKLIFKLVRESDLKYKEVAEILNISVNTVDAQMVIAVKRISEKLRSDLEFTAPRLSQNGQRTRSNSLT